MHSLSFLSGVDAVMSLLPGGRIMPSMFYAALLAALSVAAGCRNAPMREPQVDQAERELELARAGNTALHARLKEIAAYEAELERAESVASQAGELAVTEWQAEPEELSLCERQGHAARPVAGDATLFANLSVGGLSEAPSFTVRPDRPKWRLEWGCARDELSLATGLRRNDWKREHARLALGDFASGLRWQDVVPKADTMSIVVLRSGR
jgi:hypothetical protein